MYREMMYTVQCTYCSVRLLGDRIACLYIYFFGEGWNAVGDCSEERWMILRHTVQLQRRENVCKLKCYLDRWLCVKYSAVGNDIVHGMLLPQSVNTLRM